MRMPGEIAAIEELHVEIRASITLDRFTGLRGSQRELIRALELKLIATKQS